MAKTKFEFAGKVGLWWDSFVSASRAPNRLMLGTALAAFVAFGVWGNGNIRPDEAQAQPADPAANSNRVPLDADGTEHLPAMAVPDSEYLSPEAKAWVAEYLRLTRSPEMTEQVEGGPELLQRFVKRDRELFPATRKDTSIGGVHVYDYTPSGGISDRNKNRVLIELHPGGFSGCWSVCAEIQSMPIASLGRIRVIAVDFREGPKFKFPAASEDVAAVYKELLKTYPAKNIGIFGCSAGGELSGQAVAWFQTHSLPNPGAIGIYCAGEALSPRGIGMGGGDASYVSRALGDGVAPPQESQQARRGGRPTSYLSDVSLSDPMANPVISDEVLSKFPPTQIITGTRFWDLSTAVYTHSRLVKAGVDADLHVWEGLFHFFFMNPDVPESRDAYDVMIKFFDKHLGH